MISDIRINVKGRAFDSRVRLDKRELAFNLIHTTEVNPIWIFSWWLYVNGCATDTPIFFKKIIEIIQRAVLKK